MPQQKNKAHYNKRSLTPHMGMQNSASFRTLLKRWEVEVARSSPPCKQVKHLMAKFGGLLPFCIAAQTSFITIGHWNKTGIVPVPYLYRIIQAARSFGVLLRPQDLWPDFIKYDSVEAGHKSDRAVWNRAITKQAQARDAAFQERIASLALTQERRGL